MSRSLCTICSVLLLAACGPRQQTVETRTVSDTAVSDPDPSDNNITDNNASDSHSSDTDLGPSDLTQADLDPGDANPGDVGPIVPLPAGPCGTTFLVNYNEIAASGVDRFVADYQLYTGSSPAVISTSVSEVDDLPADSAPTLNTLEPVLGGVAAGSIFGGRDAIYYNNISEETFSRLRGTMEGFFRTPWSLATNTEPRAFMGGWVNLTDGVNSYRWFFEVNSESNNRIMARFGENVPGSTLGVFVPDAAGSVVNWAANTWHHVAVTWDMGPPGGTANFQIFVDGVLAARVTPPSITLGAATEVDFGNAVYVGTTSSGTGGVQGKNLEGEADSIRVSKDVLYDSSGFVLGDQVFAPPNGEFGRMLHAFQCADASPWSAASQGGTYVVEPSSVTFDHRSRGIELQCGFNLQLGSDRCYWEIPVILDFSTATSFRTWLYIAGGAGLGQFSLYFGSGTGWYHAARQDVYEGWNEIYGDLADMTIEGTPLGTNQITTLRISLWKPFATQFHKQVGQDVSVSLFDFELSKGSADGRPFELPEYDINPVLPRPNRREAGTNVLLETRIMLDEGPLYFSDANLVLDRLQNGGFNVYVPVVWYGEGARYLPTTTTSLDPAYAGYFSGADPFADLIVNAHARGMEVHAWFTVVKRGSTGFLPEYATTGTVPGFFDAHNDGFRDFIVTEIVQFVEKYAVDGVFLDYIRTGGLSQTVEAEASYELRYPGHDFAEVLVPSLFSVDPQSYQRMLVWQGEAINDIVSRVREGVLSGSRPDMVISVYGLAYPEPLLDDGGRNIWQWVNNDWIDIAFDSQYGHAPSAASLLTAQALSLFPERYMPILSVWGADPGESLQRDPRLVAKQFDYFLRRFPDVGVVAYLYGQLSDAQITTLSNGIFAEPAKPFWP